ncbi:MAG: lysophospholipid acyltransferase family protein [Candidatus Marinamargulisbacteria bacterium]
MKNHRRLARFFIKIIAKSMRLKVVTHGLENIPSNQACIFMANHTSLIDILVMVIGLPHHFNFIAKKELLWVPFIGLDMIFGGDFLIDRKDAKKARACLKKVQNRLQNGWNMLFFPEGTRSKNGELLPFKRGAFKIAFDSHATIIPCYIKGSYHIVQKNSLKARPGTVHIYFEKPISVQDYTNNRAGMIDAMNHTQQMIQTLNDRNLATPSE